MQTLVQDSQQARRVGGEAIVEVAGLTKRYGRGRKAVDALRGVDLRVNPGEVYGLLGPNGAGKSTLVKSLLTIIRPTTGRGLLLGLPIGTRHALRRVGYLPEHHRMPEYLTGRQVVEHFGALCGMSRESARRRAGELIETVGMGPWAETKLGKYSKGMRQRIGLAQALVNDPKLVVLDEPTDGVDPAGRRDIRDLVKQIRANGTTVIINSHLLSELEMVCDRLAIMVQGRVVEQGTLEELTRADVKSEVRLAGDERALASVAEGARGLGFALVEGVLVRAGAEDEPVQRVIDAARAAGLIVRGVQIRRPSLEDLFMRAVRDPSGGGELGPGAARREQSGLAGGGR